MVSNITFTFEGTAYEVSKTFKDMGLCLLPDGRVLTAKVWRETMPPQPIGLTVMTPPKAREI